jgi:hypothetical protein
MKFSTGDKVILQCFLGRQKAPGSVREDENYWVLIGEKGIVVKTEDHPGKTGERVLIEFSNSIAARGLNCHNEISNSLWILVSDLTRCNHEV